MLGYFYDKNKNTVVVFKAVDGTMQIVKEVMLGNS
jgi:hypothetical protein